MRAFSLGLKFLLELAALAAFAYWGASAAGVVLAIAAPLAAAAAWGVLAAPKSERRLPTRARIPFELGFFALAVAALAAAGAPLAAVVLAVLVLLSTGMLSRFDQWEA